MKNPAKNNTASKGFLLCFRSFPIEESIGDASENNGDSDLKSYSGNEKPNSKVYSSGKESIDLNHKKTARRILTKIVKLASLQSSLSKKVGNRKIIQDPSSTEENDLKIDSSISSSNLSSSSSVSVSTSTSSSSTASSRTSSNSDTSLGTVSRRRKTIKPNSIEDNAKKHNINSQSSISSSSKKVKISCICLLLLSMFVLIFFGKFFAIICTSTWFYFMSTTRRDGDTETPISMKLPLEIDSKEYKKKIIMEGLLERNHRGLHLH